MQVESAFPFPASPSSTGTRRTFFPRKLTTRREEFIFVLLFFVAVLKKNTRETRIAWQSCKPTETSGKTEDEADRFAQPDAHGRRASGSQFTGSD